MLAQKRKRYLINKKFQLKTTLFTTSLVFIASLPYPIILYLFINHLLERVNNNEINFKSDLTPNLLENLRFDIVVSLTLWQIGFASLVFIFYIFVSHKIAGPLYKIQTMLQNIREGNNFEKVIFRKHDHFKELADDFNSTFEYLNIKQYKKFENLKDVQNILNSLEPDISDENKKLFHKAMGQLEEIQSSFK